MVISHDMHGRSVETYKEVLAMIAGIDPETLEILSTRAMYGRRDVGMRLYGGNVRRLVAGLLKIGKLFV
jgi:hypothetical protein